MTKQATKIIGGSLAKVARIFPIFLFLLFSSCAIEDQVQWKSLFNGKDLEDWKVKISGYELNNNFGNTFRVQDGLLQVRYDQYGENFEGRYGHLFYDQAFSSYLIGVEYRFVGNQIEGPGEWAFRNSGLMIHCQDPASMEKEQDFPTSIEVQFLGGDGENERPTANICTPGTQFVMNDKIIKTHCVNSDSPTFHGNQWVRVDVLVLKDSLIKHFVNGQEVLQYRRPQLDPLKENEEEGVPVTSGNIALQSESHPIDFRKVEIVNLEKFENDPRSAGLIVERLLRQKNEN